MQPSYRTAVLISQQPLPAPARALSKKERELMGGLFVWVSIYQRAAAAA
jgi:hypothetical protein